jgi:hypothetical protein
MGFFSSLCPGCGHPLLSLGACNHINYWMNSGVAVTPTGVALFGSYDGYGRFAAEDKDDLLADGNPADQIQEDWDGSPYVQAINDDNTVWHLACWRVAGEPKDNRGRSERADDQGWFFDDPDHDLPEPRA